MSKLPAATALPINKGRVLILIAFLLLLYVVVPRVGNFSQSFTALSHAGLGWIALATLLIGVAFCSAAGTYWWLAAGQVRFWPTLYIQVASAFTNRLLPAGLGGMTLFARYLYRSHYPVGQALSIVGMNNFLGFVGHAVLLILFLLAFSGTAGLHVHWTGQRYFGLFMLVGIAVMILLAVLFRQFHKTLIKNLHDMTKYIRSFKKRPGQLAAAFGCSCLVTLCHVSILFVSAQALGVDLFLPRIFMVFTLSVATSVITPTPGGLIGAEAGLVAGFTAYGVETSPALAVALLYRFFTYWLPLIPGFIALLAARRFY